MFEEIEAVNQEIGIKTIKCPECDFELPEDELNAQIKHFLENHPNSLVVAKRRRQMAILREGPVCAEVEI